MDATKPLPTRPFPTQSFDLDKESLEYLSKIEHSIEHWSKELGMTTLRLRGLEVQLAGLYESRDNFIKQALEKAGFKSNKAAKVQVTGDGKVQFIELPEEVIATE